MYHIRNDKRAIQSANAIYHGLLRCLEHRSFGRITVTDIQRSSGVARTTIYRCFDNLSDILYWRCDLCFEEALQSVKPAEKPNELELMRGYFAYWTEHSDILKLLIDIRREDIIYACHRKHADKLARSYGALPGLDPVDRRYYLAIRTSVTIGVLKAWLDGGQKESAEELLHRLDHVLWNAPPDMTK